MASRIKVSGKHVTPRRAFFVPEPFGSKAADKAEALGIKAVAYLVSLIERDTNGHANGNGKRKLAAAK